MIKVKTSTKVTGQEKIDLFKKAMGKLDKAYVTIGVHSDAGKYTKGKNPPEVWQVALWNEYGTRDIPARSFVGATVDMNRDRIERKRDQLMDAILFENMPVQKALEELGFFVQQLIVNRIIRGIPPPNALSTQRQKALAGVLQKNIRYQTGIKAVKYTDEEGYTKLKSHNTYGKARVGIDVQLTKSKTLMNTTLLLRSISYKVYLK